MIIGILIDQNLPICSFSTIFLNVQYFDSPYYLYTEIFLIRVSVGQHPMHFSNIVQINIMLNNERPNQYMYMTIHKFRAIKIKY